MAKSKKETKTTNTGPTPAPEMSISPGPPVPISPAGGRDPIPPEIHDLLRIEEEALETGVPIEQALTPIQIATLAEFRAQYDDGLRDQGPDVERDNVPDTEPEVEEEEEVECKVISGPPLEDMAKFQALQQFIASGAFGVRSVEAQLGRMINVGVLAAKSTWQTKDPWGTAQRAHALLRDPVALAEIWRVIVWQRGRMIGNVRAEAMMAASLAILAVIEEMRDEE